MGIMNKLRLLPYYFNLVRMQVPNSYFIKPRPFNLEPLPPILVISFPFDVTILSSLLLNQLDKSSFASGMIVAFHSSIKVNVKSSKDNIFS